jgi:hypothetical protein
MLDASNTGSMKNGRSRYYGHRFPWEIISYGKENTAAGVWTPPTLA